MSEQRVEVPVGTQVLVVTVPRCTQEVADRIADTVKAKLAERTPGAPAVLVVSDEISVQLLPAPAAKPARAPKTLPNATRPMTAVTKGLGPARITKRAGKTHTKGVSK